MKAKLQDQHLQDQVKLYGSYVVAVKKENVAAMLIKEDF